MLAHGHNLGNDSFASPFNAENIREFLEVLSSGFPYRKDGIPEPAHAKRTQLLVKEFNAELTSEERDIFDNC